MQVLNLIKVLSYLVELKERMQHRVWMAWLQELNCFTRKAVDLQSGELSLRLAKAYLQSLPFKRLRIPWLDTVLFVKIMVSFQSSSLKS